MTIKKYLLAAAVAAGMATGASAATLTGNTSGVFTSEDAGFTCTAAPIFCFFGSNTGVEGASFSGPTLTWPGESTGNNNSNPPRSSLTIENTAFDVDPVPVGTADYLLGSLTWVNASSPANITPDEFSATANMFLNFSSPVVFAGVEGLSFEIENTSNPNGDDIGFMIADGNLNFGLGIPATSGNLTLNGFSFALLSGSDGSFSNGFWQNGEGGTSRLGLYANISAVPLPAAGWLMIAGLGGLGALRRRRKNAAAA